MEQQQNIELGIKGMVCKRCISTLRRAFEERGWEVIDIRLGLVRLGIDEHVSPETVREVIIQSGFELLEDHNKTTVDKIQELVHHYYRDEVAYRDEKKLSDYLEERLPGNYERISQVFSSMNSTTLEHFAQEARLEKVKELLVYTRISLTEIAARSGFSSLHHMSNHFKATTGLAPSHYRRIQLQKNKLRDS